MRGVFEFAGGSVRGKDHVLSGKNNQDAWQVWQGADFSVAVVCDGCGDNLSPYSEVGATLGSQMIPRIVLRNARQTTEYHTARFWEGIRQDALAQLRVLAYQLGDNLSEVISRNFLFTTLGALIGQEQAVFFALGDGIIIVNGVQATQDEEYPNNEPPYLAYGLGLFKYDPDLVKFRVWHIPTADLESFLVGTDGVGELIKAHSRKIPGREELVGPLSQFWENDSFFANPDMVRRKLAIINRNNQKIIWGEQRVEREPGLLRDDTTLVTGRRKGES